MAPAPHVMRSCCANSFSPCRINWMPRPGRRAWPPATWLGSRPFTLSNFAAAPPSSPPGDEHRRVRDLRARGSAKADAAAACNHFAVISAARLQAALSAWPYRVESVAPLVGGWNSATWLVHTASGRYLAKLTDDLDVPGLVSGLHIAEFLAARGLACGPPARTRDGELTIWLPEGALALLRHEPGSPPDLSVPDQVRRAGRALARTHRALRGFPASSDPRYRWLPARRQRRAGRRHRLGNHAARPAAV